MWNFFKRIWYVYSHHLDRLMIPFQGILYDQEALERVKRLGYRFDYFFPFALTASIILDTIVQYAIHGYDRKSFVFYHHIIMRFLPELFLAHGDILFTAVFLLVVTCSFFVCFVDKMPHVSFIMLQVGAPDNPTLICPYRKKFISKSLSKKMLAFYKRITIRCKYIVTFLSIELNLGHPIPLLSEEFYLTIKGNYNFSIRTIICGITSSFYLRYVVTVVHMSLQFMCQNYLIQIKQKYYIRKMNMNTYFQKHSNRSDAVNCINGYHKLMSNILAILEITREIHYFNAFYSKYVTTITLFFSMAGCAISHAVIHKYDEAPFIQLTPWIVFSGLFFALVLFLNAFSSRTIYLNFCMFKKMRDAQIILLSKRRLNPVQIVKLDLVNEYKIFLQKLSFKLSNSATINSKLFAFQIFGYVSVFYMKTVSDLKI